jgi:Sap, sulfolipid-1-addressing protein
VEWIYTELALVSLAAMLSPTTLSFSIFTLVVSDRPLRAGFWFYVGALGATLGIGVIAAIVIGNAAASRTPSTPKTWVAIFDVVAAVVLFGLVVHALRRPQDPERVQSMMEQMRKVAASPAVAIVGAGATLANAGAFIPIALKDISELDPNAIEYIADWVFFSIVSLLPLGAALILLLVAREWTERLLGSVRDWLVLHVRTIAAVLVLLVAASLLRSGIAGLTS